MALTETDLWLEYWTAHYAAQAAQGHAVSFEDEDDSYDLDAILTTLDQAPDADADAPDPEADPDAWEPFIQETSP